LCITSATKHLPTTLRWTQYYTVKQLDHYDVILVIYISQCINKASEFSTLHRYNSFTYYLLLLHEGQKWRWLDYKIFLYRRNHGFSKSTSLFSSEFPMLLVPALLLLTNGISESRQMLACVIWREKNCFSLKEKTGKKEKPAILLFNTFIWRPESAHL